MELIVISESKLKIMLSAPDMAHYELESSRMDCADAHTRAAFRHIFDDARAEIGFDTEGERLFVQLYASREGGCEIFVTKLGNEELAAPAETGGAILPAAFPNLPAAAGEEDRGELELLRRVYGDWEEEDMAYGQTDRASSPRQAALVFEDLSVLLTVCRRLLREGYRGRSGIYIIESARETVWYLLLEIPDRILFRLPRRLAFLTEYGREVPAAGLGSYLAEYGRCICEGNGVEILGRL